MLSQANVNFNMKRIFILFKKYIFLVVHDELFRICDRPRCLPIWIIAAINEDATPENRTIYYIIHGQNLDLYFSCFPLMCIPNGLVHVRSTCAWKCIDSFECDGGGGILFPVTHESWQTASGHGKYWLQPLPIEKFHQPTTTREPLPTHTHTHLHRPIVYK